MLCIITTKNDARGPLIVTVGGGILLVLFLAWFSSFLYQCMPYFTLPMRLTKERAALEKKVPGSGAPERLDGPGRERLTAGLAQSLGDPDLDVRRGAARRLSQMAGYPDANAAQALPALERALSDPDREVIEAACRAILKQVPTHPPCWDTGAKRRAE